MRPRWASSSDISGGDGFNSIVVLETCSTAGQLPHVTYSTGLPDYVFEGERQPRSAQKRPKTKVCNKAIVSVCCWWVSHNAFVDKGTGKSSHTSPDVPNKKRRLVD